MTEYRAIINTLIAKAQSQAQSGALPEIQIPAPHSAEAQGATLYFYPLPAEWGVDKQVVPTAGLSKTVAVLTPSHGMAKRLLTHTPLKVDGGPLADRKRSLEGGVYCNWTAFVDAVIPWVEMGLSQAELPPGAPLTKKDLVEHARVIFEVLKTFRGATSATYLENKVLITHTESVFQDL
jgi:hypothetical protein